MRESLRATRTVHKRDGIGLGSCRVRNWREREKIKENIGGRMDISDGTERSGN